MGLSVGVGRCHLRSWGQTGGPEGSLGPWAKAWGAGPSPRWSCGTRQGCGLQGNSVSTGVCVGLGSSGT